MPREGIEELIQLIKDMWQKNQIIKRWRTASIYTIHKKGDENLTGNYRGISLLDIGYKILASIMAERLSEKLEREKKLTEAQAGFRKKRSTIELIFVLNTIIGNRLKRKRGKLYAVFVDFKKAFDMTDRKRLWEKWKGWE